MSTQVFPVLRGLAWDVKRSPHWNNIIQEAVSGKETAIALWSYPRYLWELSYNFLRADATNHEFQDLLGFFNARSGNFSSFLFTDDDDYTVTGQSIGTGDGATLTFQLVRTLGGYSEPILAPHAVSLVKVDGVDQAGFWTVSSWGSATPGVITFSGGHAPASGKAVTADFTYYFPVRFLDSSMDFNKFLNQLYENKSVKMRSLK